MDTAQKKTPDEIQLSPEQFALAIRQMAASVGSMAELARKWNLSGQYVGDVASGKKAPGRRILALLGARKEKTVVYYLPIFKGGDDGR